MTLLFDVLAHGFKMMPFRVDDERGEVVLTIVQAQTRCTIVTTASREGSLIEGDDSRPFASREG